MQKFQRRPIAGNVKHSTIAISMNPHILKHRFQRLIDRRREKVGPPMSIQDIPNLPLNPSKSRSRRFTGGLRLTESINHQHSSRSQDFMDSAKRLAAEQM